MIYVLMSAFGQFNIAGLLKRALGLVGLNKTEGILKKNAIFCVYVHLKPPVHGKSSKRVILRTCGLPP